MAENTQEISNAANQAYSEIQGLLSAAKSANGALAEAVEESKKDRARAKQAATGTEENQNQAVEARKGAQEGLAAIQKIQVSAAAAAAFVEKAKGEAAIGNQSVQQLKTAATAEHVATASQRAATENERKLAETARSQAEAILKLAQDDRNKTDALAKKAGEIEKTVLTYEKQLTDLHGKYLADFKALKDTIEGLLPGATSAGLAEAFDTRQHALQTSQALWRNVFVGSLLAAFLLAVGFATGVLDPTPGPFDWGLFLKGSVFRLLMIGPLAWLAIFSSNRLKTAMKVEEDYAHKVATSKSFEGYRKAMASVGETKGPVQILSTNVIEVLRESPVRLHQQSASGESPLELAAAQAGTTVEQLTKLLGALSKVR